MTDTVISFPPLKARNAARHAQKLLNARALAAGHLSILVATGQLGPEQAKRQYAEMVAGFAGDLSAAIERLAEVVCEGKR